MLVIVVLALSLFGLGAMWWDKRCARLGAWRTPEKTLFLIAVVGGSLGVWAGMYLFRHKTKHMQFVIGIPVIIVAQAYCLYRFVG